MLYMLLSFAFAADQTWQCPGTDLHSLSAFKDSGNLGTLETLQGLMTIAAGLVGPTPTQSCGENCEESWSITPDGAEVYLRHETPLYGGETWSVDAWAPEGVFTWTEFHLGILSSEIHLSNPKLGTSRDLSDTNWEASWVGSVNADWEADRSVRSGLTIETIVSNGIQQITTDESWDDGACHWDSLGRQRVIQGQPIPVSFQVEGEDITAQVRYDRNRQSWVAWLNGRPMGSVDMMTWLPKL